MVASSAMARIDQVAAFFGLADLPELGARRSLGERLVVAVDVLGVGQFAGLAGNAAEELQRRRHRVGRRHVVHELGGDARVLQVFLDQAGVFLVDLLRLARGSRLAFPGLRKNGGA